MAYVQGCQQHWPVHLGKLELGFKFPSMHMTLTSPSIYFSEKLHLFPLFALSSLPVFAVPNTFPSICLQVAVGLCSVDSNYAYPSSSPPCELRRQTHMCFLDMAIIYSMTKAEDSQVRPVLPFHLYPLSSAAILKAFTIFTRLTFVIHEQG